jgi:hypothetical protein
MLKNAVDTYLAVRRAAGFKLEDDAFYLYHFARFASAHGDTHVAYSAAGSMRNTPAARMQVGLNCRTA